MGDGLAAHRGHHRPGIEAGLEHQRRPVVGAAHRHRQSAHVEERKVAQPAVAGARREVLRRGPGQRIEGAHREPGDLRLAGGAGGEEQGPVGGGVRVGIGPGDGRLPGPALERLGAGEDRQAGGVGEHPPGPDPLALGPELAGGEADVERDQGGPDAPDREEDHHRGGVVRGEHRHPLARPHVAGMQGTGHLRDLGVERPPRPAPVAGDEREPLRRSTGLEPHRAGGGHHPSSPGSMPRPGASGRWQSPCEMA